MLRAVLKTDQRTRLSRRNNSIIMEMSLSLPFVSCDMTDYQFQCLSELPDDFMCSIEPLSEESCCCGEKVTLILLFYLSFEGLSVRRVTRNEMAEA